MSELRFNLISQEWVIIATERAKRPQDFKKSKKPEIPQKDDKSCPFCPGNEAVSGHETFRSGGGDSWQVRAIYNKFPALSPECKIGRSNEGVHHLVNGFGIHEVLVEHPRHDMQMALMSECEIKEVIEAYKARYEALRKVEGIESVTIFKNQGEAAGASLKHSHSQIVATPIVPHQMRVRIDSAAHHFDVTGDCIFCKIAEQELKEGKRVVFESKHFAAFVPFAAGGPFVNWIFPKKHKASFGDIETEEIGDLAYILRIVLKKLYVGLDNPDFNYTIRSMPVNEKGIDYLHWYIVIVPRITKIAGFELGSGIFINTSLPEECAQFLREVKI